MDDDELVHALDADANEVDRLDPDPEILTLKCGIEVRLLPLRTRQLFKLMRIITHGAGNTLMNTGLALDFNDEPEDFMRKLVTIVMFSIPDAEQEAIDFLQACVEPVGLVDKLPRDMTKAERETNIGLWTELNTELFNPDPLDTLDIVEHIVKSESSDLQALGKRIRQFLELAQRTGQLRSGASSEQTPGSSESSPGRSTSSAASTAGKTRASSTSPSAASGRSSRSSRSASGRRSGAAAR